MSLFYKPIRSNTPTKDGKYLYHPCLVKFKHVALTDDIAQDRAHTSAMRVGDVHSIMRNLVEAMSKRLMNSQSVKLEGFGSFTMVIKSRGTGVESPKDVNPSQITMLKCQFTPEYTRVGGYNTRLTRGASFVNVMSLDKSQREETDYIEETEME